MFLTRQDLEFMDLDDMTLNEIAKNFGVKRGSLASRLSSTNMNRKEVVEYLLDRQEGKPISRGFDDNLARKYSCKPLPFKLDPKDVPLGLSQLLTG